MKTNVKQSWKTVVAPMIHLRNLNQQSDVRVEENKTEQTTDEKGSDKQQDNTREVEEYSESVKKRIAKLTKKNA